MAVVFKRIAKTPPAPKQVIAIPPVPSDPVEAYHAGQIAGKIILDAGSDFSSKTLVVRAQEAVKSIPPKPLATNAVTVAAAFDPKKGVVMFKRSDTGIGYKRWACWLEWTNRWTVWTEWGHESRKQARKSMDFTSETRAKAYQQSCIAAKIKRGYSQTK